MPAERRDRKTPPTGTWAVPPAPAPQPAAPPAITGAHPVFAAPAEAPASAAADAAPATVPLVPPPRSSAPSAPTLPASPLLAQPALGSLPRSPLGSGPTSVRAPAQGGAGPASVVSPGRRSLVTSTTLLDPGPGGSLDQVRGPARVRYPEPGDVIDTSRGNYRVLREVGRGAHGAVYEAIGPFDQRYAIKLQVPAMRPYAEVYAQWRAEAQRMLLLRHPNVVYLHDAFEHDFLFYMALEWCPHTLHELLGTPLSSELAVELVRQLLAAVQYLHDNDIVHGDVHAGNVLLTDLKQPVTKLADFGISQELQGRGFARPNIVHHAIMAPEVVAAGYNSRQSDLYQVGLLLFWMITGGPALDYAVPYAELVRQVTDGVPRARAEALGTPLGQVIAKMLRRREAYRYASAHEVWDDLRSLRDKLGAA